MIHFIQLGRIDYATGLQLQRSLVDLRKKQKIGDALLLLEHSPVITLGRNAKKGNLLALPETLANKGIELFEVDRGGDITFHGPGQLVGYPIFDLRGPPLRMRAVEFVRKLEEVLIRSLAEHGVLCDRIQGMTGVWTSSPDSRSGLSTDNLDSRNADFPKPASNDRDSPNTLEFRREGVQRKIAAIGIHISRGITSHGFALNVTTDLEFFKLIVPCGIRSLPVTSMEDELKLQEGRPMPGLEEVSHLVARNFGKVFGSQILHLSSLDELLVFEAARAMEEDKEEEQGPPQAPALGDRLRIPSELKQLPLTGHPERFANPLRGFQREDDELFFA